jgi:CO dehydrogenase/acetyl-CoA synthase alpha subunit
MPVELCAEMKHLNLSFVTNTMELAIEPTLEQEIRKGQLKDEKLKEIAENIVIGKAPGFRMDKNGTLVWKKDMCT